MKKKETKKKVLPKEKNNGITLIALIITIIVLLILAGVALATLTGQGNIIGNAENAVGKYNNTAQREEELINELDKMLQEKLSNKIDLPTISATTNAVGQKLQTTVTITITAKVENGNITKIIMPDKTEKIIENPLNIVTIDYEATENAEYTFIAVDEKGNESQPCNIQINNVEYIGELHMKIQTPSGTPIPGNGFMIHYQDENGDYITIKNEEGNDLIVMSDEEGKIDLTNLKYGEYGDKKEEANRVYILTHEIASDGYNKLNGPIEININSNSKEVLTQIEFKPSTILPSTGKINK